MDLAQLVAAARAKGWMGRGIALAGDYVQTVSACFGGTKGLSKHFAALKPDAIETMVKARAETLVFRPSGAAILSTTKAKKKSAEDGKQAVLSHSGTPLRKDTSALTAKSIMDFECVLTSKNRDRDGDEIDPMGAKLDKDMPLLWQHIPMEPIGKLVQVLDQNEVDVKTHFAVADTDLGRDAVVLVEFGGLRISHGFKPTKFEAIQDEHGVSGFKIYECEVMEGSLVSIPANTDAIVTAFSRNKLHAPIVKGWAKRLSDDRPVLVKGGWVPPNLKALGGRGGTVIIKNYVGGRRAGKKGAKPPTPAATTPPGKKTDADDPDQTSDKDDDEEDDDAGNEGRDQGETADGGAPAYGEMVERLTTLAADENLDPELRGRCNTVAGILAQVGQIMTDSADGIQEAVDNGDFAALASLSTQLAEQCRGKLARAAEELGRCGEIDGIGDDVTAEMTTMSAEIADALIVNAEDADATADGDPSPEAAPSERDDEDDDRDARDDDDEDEKDDDDEDRDGKDDDEDDRDEKDSDEDDDEDADGKDADPSGSEPDDAVDPDDDPVSGDGKSAKPKKRKAADHATALVAELVEGRKPDAATRDLLLSLLGDE